MEPIKIKIFVDPPRQIMLGRLGRVRLIKFMKFEVVHHKADKVRLGSLSLD